MFYIKPTGGLGNYLRVIFSWLNKARASGQHLTVIWERTAACNGNYDELFEPIRDMTVVRWTTKPLDYVGCNACGDYSLVRELVLKVPLSIECTWSSAIHVRGTDFGAADLTPFIRFIEQTNGTVFLATDDAVIQKELLTKYGNKIKVHNIIKDSGSLRATTLKQALIDMYTCVRAGRFLGTEKSTFTDIIKLLRAD